MKMPEGTPHHSDEWREIQLRRVKKFAEKLFKYGVQEYNWIMRTMFLSWFITAIENGPHPNAVLTEFDSHTQEMRQRILMYINGEIKNGEVGPS